MFGREPRLQVDLAFGLEQNERRQRLGKYAEGLRDRFKQAYEKARSDESIKALGNRRNIDIRVRGSDVQVGERGAS